MSEQIAFLGLGVMGGYMTANLARQFSVKAWNRSSNRPGIKIATEAGATIVPSIQEAVKSASIICTCLGDVPDVEEVILGSEGVTKYAQENALIVDFSTIGAIAARKIGNELKKSNLRFLDAPISGGDIGAMNGTLTIMVGGEVQDFEQCLPLFKAMGDTIRLCGGVGSGQAVKLCNQVLGAIHMVALCEAIKMAEEQDIDPNLIIEVCSTGAAGSWALSNLGIKIIEDDFKPGFMVKHILKDLRLVQEANPEENLPGVKLADSLFKKVKELENGEIQGTQAMIRAYRSNSEL